MYLSDIYTITATWPASGIASLRMTKDNLPIACNCWPTVCRRELVAHSRIFEPPDGLHTKHRMYNGGASSSQRLGPLADLQVAAADRLLMQRALSHPGASPRQSRWALFAGVSSQK